jgi:acetyl esterase/lipase
VKRQINFEISIIHPAVQEDSGSPVIIYLPTGPHTNEAWNVDDEKIISALSAASNGTVVRVNYRLDDGARYPTPIHDVLAGYDYVKERFSAVAWKPRSGQVKRTHMHFGVCGQLVGGSLASMLALTESRLADNRIAAAAINSPIVDWTFPDDIESDLGMIDGDKTDKRIEEVFKKRNRKKTKVTSWDAYNNAKNLSTVMLGMTRNTSFKKPANWFDPFASPTLFFRSAGVDVRSEKADDVNDINETPSSRPKPRKTHRNYPPSNSSLVMPHVRLSVGEANPLFDQNEEFIKLLRRSVVRSMQIRASTQAVLDRFDKEPATDMEKLELAVSAAEEKIQYHVHAGVGLWGTNTENEWLDEVWQVARWLREMLREGDSM